MLQLKDIVTRTITRQNMYCLLSVVVILMFAIGLTTIMAYCRIRQHGVSGSGDDGVQPAASDGRAVRLDVIFRAMFTFVAVFSIGVTICVCLWAVWLRRAKQATSCQSSTEQVKTGDAALCIVENDFVQYSDNNNTNKAEVTTDEEKNSNSDCNKSLLRPDFGRWDQ